MCSRWNQDAYYDNDCEICYAQCSEVAEVDMEME